MRRTGLIWLAVLLGCFSDPPSSGSSGGSTSTSDEASEGTTSVEPSTGFETATSLGDSTSTGFLGSSTTFFGTSTGMTTADTDQPPDSFCLLPVNAPAIRCTDFEVDSGIEWPALPSLGFNRDVSENPPGFSPPAFVRLSRTDEAIPGNAPRQALYEAAGADVTPGAGLELNLAVRFPPDFDALCGNAPVRLFAAQYDVGSDVPVSVVGEATPDTVRLFFFPEGAASQSFGPFDILAPEADGWRTLDVRLLVGPNIGASSIDLNGADGSSEPIPLDGFDPPGGALDVNVGPWFDATVDPPQGCSYDLDSIVLRPIPLE